MTSATAYVSVDGEIISEITGGVRLDYLTDALGSVTATLDQTAAATHRASICVLSDLSDQSILQVPQVLPVPYTPRKLPFSVRTQFRSEEKADSR